MSEHTKIAWTDHTFNIAWGCTKVSPGCAHCYAERLNNRYKWSEWGKGGKRKTMVQGYWNEPRKWNARAERNGQRERVFTSSMCDIFEDDPVVERELRRLWLLIRGTPWLDWQLLTKRPERILDTLPSNWGEGWPNVWLGVSIENSDYVGRADILRRFPAVVRFISYEPALGPLDGISLAGFDWLIYGGESGPGYRPDDPAWATAIQQRCHDYEVAYFYKQSAGQRPGTVPADIGTPVRAFPAPREVSGL